MIRKHLILLVLIFWSFISFSQVNYWSPVDVQSLRLDLSNRDITPSKYETYFFDFNSFSNSLASEKPTYFLDFPLGNGQMVTFELNSTSVFAPELSSKYSGFYSFTGKEINGLKYIKISVSPYSINGMIFLENGESVFIDPISRDNKEYYQVYNKKDFKKKTGNFTCGLTSMETSWDGFEPDMHYGNRMAGDCQFRQYRLALACTGEYASFHGGTIERVLAAFNTTITRINGVYEREIGVTLKLIPDTDKLIFFNAATDPYSNNNGETMLGQNQTTVDGIIGRNNYDIGHVFSTGGGGVASLRSVCTSRKAQGVTGQNRPVGDPFDIDYVAHEMGHQFGANHTQNNNCQRSGSTAMEPGSASTIMGYAGICQPNVQNASDDYFHAISLQEMSNFIVAGQGGNCPEVISTQNEKPMVNVPKNSYTIPTSTPFVLTATASDSNGDNLTYCWEQMDNEVANMPPRGTNISGPSFRSFSPTSSSSRYFPTLGARNPTWEVLPSVARDMNFRCTVRDNSSLYGCTDEVNVSLSFVAVSGSFRVTAPNTQGIQWQVGSTQSVEWNVAGTNSAPINCSAVDIFLSTDGGLSYPHLIVANVPNTGSAQITVPNLATNAGRIMVKASDNIFFNVSGFNFRIVTSFSMEIGDEEISLCNETSRDVTINIFDIAAFNGPLNLTIGAQPLQIQTTLSPELFDVIPATSTLNLRDLNLLSLGGHEILVRGVAGNETQVLNVAMYKYNPGVKTSLLQPLNNTLNVANKNINFEWIPLEGVKEYRCQISKRSDFSIIESELMTSQNQLSITLDEATVYYWRVEAKTPCKTNNWSDVFLFTTEGFADGNPIVLTQNPIVVLRDGSKNVTQVNINLVHENPELVRFSLLRIPRRGSLLKEGGTLFQNSTFTLNDIINERIQYVHDGGVQSIDSFRVQVLDDKNRLLPELTVMIDIIQFSLTFSTQVQNVQCHGDSTGSILILGFNGQEPYSYSIDGQNFVNNNRFEDLKAGVYNITVRDGVGGEVQRDVFVSEPHPYSVDIVQDFYNFTAMLSGGTGDLLISFNEEDFSENNVLSQPENGLYTIQIKDFFDCLYSENFEVDIPELQVDFNPLQDIACFGQKAQVRLTAMGGFPPYLFSADDSFFIESDTFSLDAGNYSFVVLDAGGKKVFSDEWKSNDPQVITIIPQNSRFIYTLNGAGGTGPLSYSLDNSIFVENDTIIFPSNGNYTVYMRDSLGCQRTFSIRVNVLSRVSIVQRDAKCFGSLDGFLSISPSGGISPFEYQLNDQSVQTLNRWTNLPAGTYEYRVRDAVGDTLVGQVVIGQPELITVDIISTTDGRSIFLEVQGGTPPYRYSLNGGDSYLDINAFSDLDIGVYEIIVRDENGCVSETLTWTIVSTFDHVFENIKIAPNPVGDILSVTGLGDIKVEALEIRNLLGHLLYRYAPSDTHLDPVEIDVNELSSGMYLLRIVSSKGDKSLKWIKK